MFSKAILEMKGVSKSFFGIKVLSEVDFSVYPGEVHALMGENGAGKSTLMKIIMGIYKSDEGAIKFEGNPVNIKNARDALNLGISMIHQELNPIMEMTVAENVFIGREARVGHSHFISKAKMNHRTQKLLEEYGMADRVSPSTKMNRLSIAQIQMMEIIKAISYNSKVIIMDEPTSSLTENESRELFKTIDLLKKKGTGIIYISHRIEEVLRLSDRISVLRDGQLVGCLSKEEVSRGKIISMMVGRALSSGYPHNNFSRGEVVLSIKNFSRKNAFSDISFDVHRGEILGFAGLIGAGRSEVMRALVGYDKLDHGEVYLEGNPIIIKHPVDAKRHRIILASEDRKALGLILCRNIKENVSIQNESLYSSVGFMNHHKERNVVNDSASKMAIKMNSIQDITLTLSGGNQQKVVLAKCLLTTPKVMIFDEPTRGIDVGAKAEIYQTMVTLAQSGISIIMISSEMPELIGMSNRILVMANGRIVEEFTDPASVSQEEILRAALGGN